MNYLHVGRRGQRSSGRGKRGEEGEDHFIHELNGVYQKRSLCLLYKGMRVREGNEEREEPDDHSLIWLK